MTYQDLYDKIGTLTPEQRTRPAVVGMQQTGEVAEIDDLIPIADFNDTQLPDQFALMYENREDPKIF